MYKRSAALFFVCCLFLGVLCARLLIINEMQVKNTVYTANTISAVADRSRGVIYDCSLNRLVNSESVSMLAVKPDINSLLENNNYILNDDKNSIFNDIQSGKIGLARYNGSGYSANSDSILFTKYNRYKQNGEAVHLVGYINSDGEGVCGIEKYYNSLLSSKSGSLKIICSVDAYRKALRGEKMKIESNNYNTSAGVELTVDIRIQQLCEKALEQFGIECGAIVALEVGTSEIKAMASAPEFSQLNPAEYLDNDNAPFINRAITPYSVGSVFKPVVAAAALENGITADLEYFCNGSLTLGEVSFGCHRKYGHGQMNMFSAMVDSCNPYFINLALNVGKTPVCDMAQRLGLGKSIELCDGWYTEKGIMPEADSLVSEQDLANLAFGQGRLLASPLQMAAVYAAIANEGVYRAPSLMRAIIDENRIEIMRAELPASRRAMSVQTAETLKELLHETVEKGSSGRAKPESVSAAGKTATAQSGQFKNTGEEITQSWFCGFFPYDSPKYALAILKENGQGGSADCAPVFRFLADGIMQITS